MADIELIIKISEDSYKATCNGWMLPSDVDNVIQGIKKGTPLPKGHGDLIDRNSILCTDLPCDLCGHTDECFKLLAPTIIEADKAESEYKEKDE